MPLLKGERPHLSLYPLYVRDLVGVTVIVTSIIKCNLIIEEALQLPTFALCPFLSYKLKIKNLFRNKTMLYGETQVSHDV